MKLYSLDHGYYGSVLVVANTLEEAFTKILLEHPATESTDLPRVKEHEFNADFVFLNLGDM